MDIEFIKNIDHNSKPVTTTKNNNSNNKMLIKSHPETILP